MKLFWKNSENIDSEKWNECIYESGINLVYPQYWYLNIVADKWGGIVNDDYSCVMPVVWNKKYGLKYAYRPFLVQQLGIYSKNREQNNSSLFVDFLKKKFVKINYNFNYLNNFRGEGIVQNTNYILNFAEDYQSLRSRFSNNTKRNIAKARKQNLQFIDNVNIDDFINFKIKNLTNKLTSHNFETLKKLFIEQRNNITILGVKSGEELVSALLLLFYNKKFYYLAAATNEKGKQTGASFFLLDNFIQSQAATSNFLDFEGSNIPGIARFFESWGAEKQHYQTLNYIRMLLMR